MLAFGRRYGGLLVRIDHDVLLPNGGMQHCDSLQSWILERTLGVDDSGTSR